MIKILKQQTLYILTFASLVMTSSCDKELDQVNPNAVSKEIFWKSEADALAGLNGVFDAWQVSELSGARYMELDHLTDNATTNNNNNWLDIEASTHIATNPRTTGRWKAYYNVIQRANLVIKEVTGMAAGTIKESARKRVVAEAMFMRAFAYNDLVTLFGNLPFYTEPVTAFENGKARTSKADINTYLINELKTTVIPNLPVVIGVSERGRISADAAKALLGKVYLYNERWSEAAVTFKEIIDGGRYALYPNYAELFTQAGEFSKENLWEINFEEGGIDNGETFSIQIDTSLAEVRPRAFWRPIDNFANSFLAIDGKPTSASAIYGGASPFYIPATASAGKFNNRDPRLKATMFTAADITPSGKRVWNFVNSNAATLFTSANNFAIKKYFTITPTQFNGGPQNFYMIRYADVLLMYAEAKNEEIAAPDATIYNAVNAIRRRLTITENLAGGKGALTGAATASPVGEGLVFDLTSSILLKRVNINLATTAAGPITISLKNSSGTVLNSKTTTITAVTGTGLRVVTLPLFFNISPGNGYSLVLNSAIPVAREASATYPMTLFGAGAITAGTPVAANYNYFYNLQYDLTNSTARMPDYPAGLTKALMRQMIRDERRWELGLEGTRYYDLFRWKVANTVIPASLPSTKKFTDPRDFLWPYPQEELDNNPNMKKDGQNPGW